MPPTLLDLLWIFLKVVGALVLIDLSLMYLIWRVRGISRAQERRRRERIGKRRAKRKAEQYRVIQTAVDNGWVDHNEARTVMLPRQQEREKFRANR